MVAATPDKWIWDIKKENCFKASDIESFRITIKSNEEYIVRADCKHGTMFILEIFEKHKDAINSINTYIKENL
jgi:hypothetical protein